MTKLDFFNNYSDALCVISSENKIIFTNKAFLMSFPEYTSFEKFKNRFNFNLCFLSSDSFINQTPLDLMLSSKENFHTYCTYQNSNGEYIYYYIYTFKYNEDKITIFKNITAQDNLDALNRRFSQLKSQYDNLKENQHQYTKLQELSQAQILKMGIINRISLVIRETNNLETIFNSTLEEIHNLLGSFKTYFLTKEKNYFKIRYSIPAQDNINVEYEDEVLLQIKNKNIVVTNCLKEYLNSKDIMPRGIKRIIIPVYNKNKLLGIIVTLTKQKFVLEDNREILQSISVQLSSSIIQAELINQLNKKNKKLQKTLNELKETQMQLINTEKMASIGQLISGVAHEINTPLASICSNNNLINKILSTNENITHNQKEILKDLNAVDIEASNRISNMVKSLKRFVRLDEAEFQSADINKEIDLTLKLIAHEINNIEIIKNYSNLPPVMCSVNMLNQVFMNLLVNACQSITGFRENGRIEITTKTAENNLVVTIKDNGKGIAQNLQNKIFNAGFTTKQKGIGTGLGLSISKKIIELHKGSISFHSKENEGSEFTVTIPIVPA